MSPEEYDYAALHNPAACPLRLTGDLRPARQLLADAAADSLVSIAALTRTLEGQRVLSPIATYLDLQVGRFAAAGTRLRSHCHDDDAGEPAAHVHRPVPFILSAVDLRAESESPLLAFFSQRQVASATAARWMLNVGYSAFRLAGIVAALPPRPAAALARLVTATQRRAVAAANVTTAAFAAAAAQDYEPAGGAGANWTAEEVAMWEEEAEVGNLGCNPKESWSFDKCDIL